MKAKRNKRSWVPLLQQLEGYNTIRDRERYKYHIKLKKEKMEGRERREDTDC